MASEVEHLVNDEGETFLEEPEEDEATEGSQGWSWWLLVIPAIALVDLVVALLFAANVFEPSSFGEDVELFHIVIAGLIVLVVLLIVELALLAGRHPDNLEDDEEPAPSPGTPAARQEEPPELEALATDDEVDGRHVVEVSRPPKSVVDAGVYATTYVEIDREQVLRLEEIVALRP